MLLGEIMLRRSDGVVILAGAIPTSKALDLLRLLVGADGQERDAGHYVGQLWPQANESRGRMSLRTAVAQLRRALGPEVVRRSGDLLRLGEVETDVGQFRAGAQAVDHHRRQGQDAEVLRVVRDLEESCGADLVVSGTSCDGVYALRDELRELRAQVLLDGAAAATRLSLPRESLDLAQKADDLVGSESSARALMVAWSSLGETRRVIETFERLRDSLEASYGVQPSRETRALYLQVVTAGEGLRLHPADHHPEVVIDVASTTIGLDEGVTPGGVIWLHGEPGSGRGAVAREAVRLLQRVRPDVAERLLLLPEVITLDDLERQRLRREALADHVVLVVPVRRRVVSRGNSDEVFLDVPALDRAGLRDLVTQLLQERPSPVLEERLWSTTAGLAGQVCRTVAHLVRQGQLRWTPGEVGFILHPDALRQPPDDDGDLILGSR